MLKQISSELMVLVELRGGFAVVNTNDLTAALKRIDADTSDYYMPGSYSSNPDTAKRRRRNRDQGETPLG